MPKNVELPAEVILELRDLVGQMAHGQAFSITLHSNGINKWKSELKITREILLATAHYDTTTGVMRTVTAPSGPYTLIHQ